MGRPPKKPKLSDEEIAALIGSYRLKGWIFLPFDTASMSLFEFSCYIHNIFDDSKKARDWTPQAVFNNT